MNAFAFVKDRAKLIITVCVIPFFLILRYWSMLWTIAVATKCCCLSKVEFCPGMFTKWTQWTVKALILKKVFTDWAVDLIICLDVTLECQQNCYIVDMDFSATLHLAINTIVNTLTLGWVGGGTQGTWWAPQIRFIEIVNSPMVQPWRQICSVICIRS